MTNELSKHCLLACINFIMKKYGMRFDECELFLLGHGFELSFELDSLFLGATYSTIIKNINNLGIVGIIELNKNEINDSDALKSFINSHVRQQEPVILYVNGKCLTYHTDFLEINNHFILANGIDSSINKIHIFDLFFKNSAGIAKSYTGSIDAEQLYKDIKSCIIVENFNLDKKNNIIFNIKDLLLNSLEFFLSGRNQSIIDNYLNVFLTISSGKDVSQQILNMYYYLKHAGIFHVLFYTKQLVEKYNLTDDCMLNELDQRMVEWKNFCLNMLKIYMKGKCDSFEEVYNNGMINIDKINYTLNKVIRGLKNNDREGLLDNWNK